MTDKIIDFNDHYIDQYPSIFTTSYLLKTNKSVSIEQVLAIAKDYEHNYQYNNAKECYSLLIKNNYIPAIKLMANCFFKMGTKFEKFAIKYCYMAYEKGDIDALILLANYDFECEDEEMAEIHCTFFERLTMFGDSNLKIA